MFGVLFFLSEDKKRMVSSGELQLEAVEGGWIIPGRPAPIFQNPGWYKLAIGEEALKGCSEGPFIDNPKQEILYISPSIGEVQSFCLGVVCGLKTNSWLVSRIPSPSGN